MPKTKKILCACYSNSDRSPLIKALLEQMLSNQGTTGVEIDSVGVGPDLEPGGSAPNLSIKLGRTYGIDLSKHRKKPLCDTFTPAFDLVIAADKEVQAVLMRTGVKAEIICLELDGAANAWKSLDPRKVEEMILSIHAALLRYVISYKFRK